MVYYVLGKNTACPFLYYSMQDGFYIMKTNQKIFGLIAALVPGLALGAWRALSYPYGGEPTLYYIMIAASMLMLAFLSIKIGSQPAPEHQEINDMFKTAVVLASLLSIAAACLRAYAMVGSPINVISVVCTGLLLVSATGMITMISKNTDAETSAVMASAPIFFAGVYLLDCYRNIASKASVIREYGIEMVAISFILLAAYFVAYMRFKDRSGSFAISFSVMGAVLFAGISLTSFIFSLPASPYPFGLSDVLAVVSIALYSAAWYLCPPPKYEDPNENEEESFDEEDIPDHCDPSDIPSVEEIIEEYREIEKKSEN